MHTNHRLVAALALVVPAVLFAGCAGSSASLNGVGSEVDNGGGPGIGIIEGGAAASAAPPAPAAGAPGEGSTAGGDGLGAPIDDAKIVRTGTVELQVSDVPKALAAARDGIRAMGGYIGASQTQNEGDSPVASVTYRIPVARWEDALDLLGGLNGLTTKVVSQQTNAVEVTSQVVDLEARIKNLKASETALQGIAANAVKVSDVLEGQNQLTQVRGEIESLTAQLKDLNDRATYATLTASFRVPVIAVEVAKQGWDPAKVVDDASASLVNVLQALTTAGIWFAIVWLPILLVIGVVSVIAIAVARRMGFRGRGAPPAPGAPTSPAAPSAPSAPVTPAG